MRKLFLLLTFAMLYAGTTWSQNVNINSTGGTPVATYPTLGAAFTAINNGVHTGQILVAVVANTNEGATSAILNASGTGSASYTKVYIGTTLSNAVVSGAPPTGAAVVKLSGADNVTINGAQNGSGTTRNLTIENTTAAATANTAALWVQSAGTAAGCVNDTIMNCIIRGNDATNTTATSTFGLFVAGTTIGTAGSGADNDNLAILNNDIRRCWVGIFARGTAAGVLNNLVIAGNLMGNATQAESWGRNGIDIQQATSAIITLNDIGNTSSASTSLMFGIELGTGTTSCVVSRNNFHDIVNLGSSGCWGINIANGTGNVAVNNFVSNIKHSSTSITSSTTIAAGIRINGGTGHQIYYNTVNLYGTTTHTGVGHSAGLVITTTGATGLNIRNNIFANSMNFPIAGSEAHGVLTINTYNFTTATSTINNNGYFVPANNTSTTSYNYGSQMGLADHGTLSAWAAFTGQDAASIPAVRQAATFFTSSSDLHIAANPVIIESAGINVAGLTTDYDNQIRQGNGGYSQVPAGTAPDIGADEVATTVTDYQLPVISAILTTPGSSCTPVSHTVTCTVTDASGLASVVIKWFINGVAQADIPMVNTGGNNWSGTIPASGSGIVSYYIAATDLSPVANVANSPTQTYQDNYLLAEAGPADSVCQGSSITLNGATSFGNTIKITEITQFSTGTGQTTPYPSWLPSTGFEDYIEISNLGTVNVDISGYTVFVEGITTRQLTFPAGTTLPSNAVLILHIGTGTNDPVNRLYNMGGANNIVQSGSTTGYYVKDPGGKVVDAVATNSYVFSAASGVTSSDWTGNIASSSGRAGVIRTVSDNNNATDWTLANSPTPLQTLGAINPGLTLAAQPTATWDGAPTSGTASISPATTGYHIFSVTDGVCTSTDSVMITVLPLPAAPVTVGDTVCGTDSATVSATPVSGVINWYDAAVAGNLLGTGNNLTIYVSGPVTVYAEENNGACSGTRTAADVTWFAADSISGVATAGPFCEFAPITLSATSANTSYTYNWFGSSIVAASGNPANTTVSMSGPIYLEGIDSAGCRMVDTLPDISVTPAPDAMLGISDSMTLCIGSTDTIWMNLLRPVDSFYVANNTPILDPPNPAQNDTLVVTNGPGSLLPGTLKQVCININHTWDSDINISLISPSGTAIDLSSANGGSGDNYTNTCFDMTAATNITAGAAPFTGNFIPEDATGFAAFDGENPNGNWVLSVIDVAAGDVGTILNWWIVFDLPEVTYSWSSVPAGFTSTADSVGVSPDTTTTYTVVVTDTSTGCTRELSYTVPVYPELSVSISGATNYCASGTLMNLVATATGGNGVYSYDWNGLGTNDTLSVIATSDTMFVVNVLDSCSTPMATDTVFITGYPLLGLSVSADTTVCPGDSVVLVANASGGDGVYTYAWSSGGNTMTETVAPTTTTTYTVTVTDGCGYDLGDTTLVTVAPLPVAVFTFAPTNPQAGQTVTFTNNSTNATTYSWTLGTAGTSTQTNPTQSFANPGSQTITLIATNSCGSDTTTQTVTVLTSVNQALGNGMVSIWPNPSEGVFNIGIENLGGSQVNMQVLDLRGELVWSNSLHISGTQEVLTLDLGAVTKGVYFLQMESEGQTLTSKLVAQ